MNANPPEGETATEATATAVVTAPAGNPFDLGALGDTNHHVFTPNHPATGEPMTGFELDIAGEDTKEYRDALADAQRVQAKRLQKSGSNVLDTTAFNIDFLSGIVLGWRMTGAPDGTILWNGSTMKCTKENKKRVFGERAWLSEQTRAFINDRAKRLGNS